LPKQFEKLAIGPTPGGQLSQAKEILHRTREKLDQIGFHREGEVLAKDLATVTEIQGNRSPSTLFRVPISFIWYKAGYHPLGKEQAAYFDDTRSIEIYVGEETNIDSLESILAHELTHAAQFKTTAEDPMFKRKLFNSTLQDIILGTLNETKNISQIRPNIGKKIKSWLKTKDIPDSKLIIQIVSETIPNGQLSRSEWSDIVAALSKGYQQLDSSQSEIDASLGEFESIVLSNTKDIATAINRGWSAQKIVNKLIEFYDFPPFATKSLYKMFYKLMSSGPAEELIRKELGGKNPIEAIQNGVANNK
jgi:hypothetical protein